MELESNRLLNLMVYITCTCLYAVGVILVYNLLYNVHYYYLFIAIPILFLLVTLGLLNLSKMILMIFSIIFGRNDNIEVNNSILGIVRYLNKTCTFTLIGIFISLLSSIVVLDIILCVSKELYFLISLSLVVWILLYYIMFRLIVRFIRREIRL